MDNEELKDVFAVLMYLAVLPPDDEGEQNCTRLHSVRRPVYCGPAGVRELKNGQALEPAVRRRV